MKLSTLAFGPKKTSKTAHEPPAGRRNLFTVSPSNRREVVESAPRHTYCDGADATR